jgi:YggT family protein
MPFILFLYFIPALIFFLRFLMQYTCCPYYQPICRYTALVTNPFLKLLGNKSIDNINISSLIWMIILAELVGFSINFNFIFEIENIDEIIRIASILFLINLVLLIWAIFTILSYILIIGGILSWIPKSGVRSWCELFLRMASPITAPLDKFIPPIGVISISYLIAFLILSILDSVVMPKIVDSLLRLF